MKQLISEGHPIYIYIYPTIYQEILQRIREDKVFEEIKIMLEQYQMINIDLMNATNYAINLYRCLQKKE
ncbi:MAG: hypothetical protein LBJ93_01260 [Clostridiales bacterium]|nr:hypothetical protein [Clostridiales bacterium]